jgi:hypothetical protein
MGRFALSWSADDGLHAVNLDPGREYLIGRAEPADIVLPIATVSRRQATLRARGTAFAIENVSTTNPTRIGDVPTEGPTVLADGTLIRVGEQRLHYWDLAAGDRISGPVCSHCGRENVGTDAECWFCGTSLVNAPTGIRTKRRVMCRFVGADGQVADLVEEQALAFGPDGSPGPAGAAAERGGPMASMDDGRPVLAGAGAVVERGGVGEPAGEGRALETGDVVRVGQRSYVAIVR